MPSDHLLTASPRQRRGWRRLLRPATLALLGLGVWLVVVGLTLTWARNDAARGLDLIEQARSRSSPADLAQGRPAGPLREARSSFESSSRLLGSPVLAPLRLLPVAGRQLRSGHALTKAAAEVAGAGVDAVSGASSALARPHGSGPERVALLRELSGVAGRAAERLRRVDLGPGRALVGPLASRRRQLADELDRARTGLRDGRVALTGLADLLAGPRRYLVLAANNSEMRAGSGMFLSIGELTTANGDLSLGDFRPAAEYLLPPQLAPPIEDPDLAGRWGWLEPNREWRNLAASPRFPASAALASRMWAATGGGAVDGVLALDPLGLQAVVRATGPVDVGGRTVTADGVDDLLLHDQYAGLRGSDTAAQAARREQLGVIAKSALVALQTRDWDAGQLSSGLAQAARGRHLMAWSARPEEQRAWSAAKLNGAIGPSSLVVSVLNQAGNKLDRFLHVEATLRFERQARSVGATLQVLLQNTTPDGEPPYVTGPFPGSGLAAGDYAGILSVNLPGGAGFITVEGRETFSAAGSDGPTKVVAVPVSVKKGGAQSFTLRFRLPQGHGPLRVEPSARVPAVTWSTPGGSFESGEARSVAVG